MVQQLRYKSFSEKNNSTVEEQVNKFIEDKIVSNIELDLFYGKDHSECRTFVTVVYKVGNFHEKGEKNPMKIKLFVTGKYSDLDKVSDVFIEDKFVFNSISKAINLTNIAAFCRMIVYRDEKEEGSLKGYVKK